MRKIVASGTISNQGSSSYNLNAHKFSSITIEDEDGEFTQFKNVSCDAVLAPRITPGSLVTIGVLNYRGPFNSSNILAAVSDHMGVTSAKAPSVIRTIMLVILAAFIALYALAEGGVGLLFLCLSALLIICAYLMNQWRNGVNSLLLTLKSNRTDKKTLTIY